MTQYFDSVKTWLGDEIFSISEIESQHMISNKQLGPSPVAFGFQHQHWIEFKSRMEAGDEIREYTSPSESWEENMGSAGIALVRNGKVIATLQTRMN
jgi:hypothetical protein